MCKASEPCGAIRQIVKAKVSKVSKRNLLALEIVNSMAN